MIWGIDGTEWLVWMAAAFGVALVRAGIIAVVLASIQALLYRRGESSISVPQGA